MFTYYGFLSVLIAEHSLIDWSFGSILRANEYKRTILDLHITQVLLFSEVHTAGLRLRYCAPLIHLRLLCIVTAAVDSVIIM